MSCTFPEYPGKTFLAFREVCDLLPEDAQRHLLRFGLKALKPYACWGSSPTPYVPRPAPAGWLASGPSIEFGALYFHSTLRYGHKGPAEALTLYFDKARVQAFKAAGDWAPHPDTQLPWFMRDEPDRGGRPMADWWKPLVEARERKGARLEVAEGLEALAPLPPGVNRHTEKVNNSGAMEAAIHVAGRETPVTMKHFKRVLREIEGRLNPEGE